MRDPQIVLLGGVAVIDLIEFGAAVIRSARALIALGRVILGSGGHDGHARLRQRLFQRLERRIDIMRPAVGRGVADRGVIVAGPLHIGDRRIGAKPSWSSRGPDICCVSCVSTARRRDLFSVRLEIVGRFLNCRKCNSNPHDQRPAPLPHLSLAPLFAGQQAGPQIEQPIRNSRFAIQPQRQQSLRATIDRRIRQRQTAA